MCNLYNWEICDCECHNDPKVKHVMACCFTCKTCGKNISFLYKEDHNRRHQQEEKEQSNG